MFSEDKLINSFITAATIIVFVFFSNSHYSFLSDSFWLNLLLVPLQLLLCLFAVLLFCVPVLIINTILEWREKEDKETSKKEKTNILLIIIIIAIVFTAFLTSDITRNENKGEDKKQYTSSELEDLTVYITKSGSKYHFENCPTIANKTKRAKNLPAAADDYEPCSVCNPPKY